jgi:hypothetical protein
VSTPIDACNPSSPRTIRPLTTLASVGNSGAALVIAGSSLPT